jgi:hypothetical protein
MTPLLVQAEEHLWESARLGSRSDQPLATQTIYLWLRGLLVMGRIKFAPDPVFHDILPRCPNRVTDEERGRAESTLRSMFSPSSQRATRSLKGSSGARRSGEPTVRLLECLRITPGGSRTD